MSLQMTNTQAASTLKMNELKVMTKINFGFNNITPAYCS